MATRSRRPPHNVNVLRRWVGEEARATGVAQLRLQRWISFMVVAAALDTVRDEDGDPVFLLKGGVAMELRLGLGARATRDYDAAYRDRSRSVLERLDEALARPHGDFRISRLEPEEIRDTGTLRVDLKLTYHDRSWGTVRLELARAEGEAGREIDRVPAIPIDSYGLQGPTTVACVAVRHQIAQKLHACTEVPPDGRLNDRFRDLIDLLLLRDLVESDLAAVRAACLEIFELRGTHSWPPTVTVFEGWPEPYAALAAELGYEVGDAGSAAARVGEFVDAIDAAVLGPAGDERPEVA
jgi:hypothetical protein